MFKFITIPHFKLEYSRIPLLQTYSILRLCLDTLKIQKQHNL